MSSAALAPPPSFKLFLAGRSGSGKSYQAWHTYLIRFHRRILLDWTGEWADYGDAVCQNVEEFAQALRHYARKGKWTLVLDFDSHEEVVDLVDYLIPLGNMAGSPIRQLGGAVLLNDEVDLMAPPRSLQPHVRTLYRRARHVGLSILSLTQRPEAVSREVSAQSQQAMCMALTEAGGYAYMEDLVHQELRQRLPAWTRLHPHGGVWWNLSTGEERWTDGRRWLTGANSPSRADPGPRAPAPEAAAEVEAEAEPEAPEDLSSSDGGNASVSAPEPEV